MRAAYRARRRVDEIVLALVERLGAGKAEGVVGRGNLDPTGHWRHMKL